jgi:hypothetical protein
MCRGRAKYLSADTNPPAVKQQGKNVCTQKLGSQLSLLSALCSDVRIQVIEALGATTTTNQSCKTYNTQNMKKEEATIRTFSTAR